MVRSWILVNRELIFTLTHVGSGRNSKQQRAMVLLKLLDPALDKAMGTNTLETGDYQWRDDMMADLAKSIDKKLQKWVTKGPPFCYDTNKPADVQLWITRRQHGMEWSKSASARQLAKTAYQAYAERFSAVTKDESRSTFHKCLDKFLKQVRAKEQGELKELQKVLLLPIGLLTGCTEANVIDKFSFVSGNFLSAVFDFFASKIKKAPVMKVTKRLKDREDDSKTYYICGVVARSMETRAKNKANCKQFLSALDNLKISADAAAKHGLPTRHVTLRNRGGLIFASANYYLLMCKVEDRFYSTVGTYFFYYFCFHYYVPLSRTGHDARQLSSHKSGCHFKYPQRSVARCSASRRV